MKHSQTSIIFASLVLSTTFVHASDVASKQGRPTETSSSFWNYFGFGKKVPAVPASAAPVENKNDPDESWTLIDMEVDESDNEYLVYKEERVTEEELKAHNQEMKKRALELHDKKRLAHVKRANGDEAVLSVLKPDEPKVSAKWYQGVAPTLLQEEVAIMMTESEDEQPRHNQILNGFDADEAVLVGNEIEVDEQQPIMDNQVPEAPLMDDQVPDAPHMDAIVMPVRAPVHEVVESAQKPKDPNVFRGKTVQMGLTKSDESAASDYEASLIQQFKIDFQVAQDRTERRVVVDKVEKALQGNAGYMELHKLKVQLFLQLQREVIETDSEDENEEVTEFH